LIIVVISIRIPQLYQMLDLMQHLNWF